MTVASPPSAPARALISPQIDFWLVGGASVVFMSILFILTTKFQVDFRADIVIWFLYASFLVNYPHFAYSYQLFYADFLAYLRDEKATAGSKIRVVTAGVIVPVLIIAYFAYIAVMRDISLLSYAVNAFWFFVGWHYVKQGYGVLITLSVYKKVFYSLWQKRAILANAYATWIYFWVETNSRATDDSFFGVPFATFDLPPLFSQIAFALFCITTLLTLAAFLHASIVEKKGFSPGGAIGYFSALYIWWPILQSSTIFYVCVPFFHSLQYLPFVYRLEKGKQRELQKQKPEHPVLRSMIQFGLIGVFLGGMFLDIFPKAVDKFYSSWGEGFVDNFFFLGFFILINIHHYFIDSAFWRKDNATVQKLLFSS